MSAVRVCLCVWAIAVVLPGLALAQSEAIPCTPSPTDMPIAYGTVVTCPEGQTGRALFRFEGTAGDYVVAQFVGPICTGPFELSRTLGSAVVSQRDCADGRYRLAAVLAETGTYILGRTPAPGPYSVTLDRIVPLSPTARALVPGLTAIDVIQPAAELDLFYLNGFAGDSVALWTAGQIGGAPRPCLELYRPDGSQLQTSAACFDPERGVNRVEAVLDRDGRHVILARAADNQGGPYGVTLEYSKRSVCEAVASEASYQDGQRVSGTLRISTSRSTGTEPIELKLWLRSPDTTVLGLINQGGEGNLRLEPGHDTMTPFDLFTVQPWLPRGEYRLGCRLLNPVTGGIKVDTIRSFWIQ